MRASCTAKFQMLSQLEQPSLSLSQLLCSNTWTTSQPHCSHIQPQRCSSGPPEATENGLLAAFQKRPLQAAVSCFFFPQDRSSRVLAPNRQLCTRATGVQEGPTTSFVCMAVCVEVRFFLASHSKLLHLANFGNSASSDTGVNQLSEAVFA